MVSIILWCVLEVDASSDASVTRRCSAIRPVIAEHRQLYREVHDLLRNFSDCIWVAQSRAEQPIRSDQSAIKWTFNGHLVDQIAIEWPRNVKTFHGNLRNSHCAARSSPSGCSPHQMALVQPLRCTLFLEALRRNCIDPSKGAHRVLYKIWKSTGT